MLLYLYWACNGSSCEGRVRSQTRHIFYFAGDFHLYSVRVLYLRDYVEGVDGGDHHVIPLNRGLGGLKITVQPVVVTQV